MIYSLGEHTPTIAGDVFIADSASVIGDVHLEAQTSVWFGAVLRGDVERLTIGRGTNIQDNSVCHADPGAPLVVGERVTIGHMATVHGCRIGNGSLIGVGAVVLNNARIGANCLVGAKALVTEDKEFPDGWLIIGTPAKAARPLTPDEIARIHGTTQRYIDRAQLYRRALRRI